MNLNNELSSEIYKTFKKKIFVATFAHVKVATFRLRFLRLVQLLVWDLKVFERCDFGMGENATCYVDAV
jgi:hypothetical protein